MSRGVEECHCLVGLRHETAPGDGVTLRRCLRKPTWQPSPAARRLVDGAERITVLTGAGISTDSGLPDFRGPQGLWTRDPAAERASNIDVYVTDPDVRRQNWARRAEGSLWADVAPNRGHEALVHLERRGKLQVLITQNVDELHQRAGSDPSLVVEIHGTTRKIQCLSCDYRDEMETVLDRVRAGGGRPALPALRLDPQVGDGLLRSEPRPGGPAAIRAGVGRLRPVPCGRYVAGSLADQPHCFDRRARRGRGGDRQWRADRTRLHCRRVGERLDQRGHARHRGHGRRRNLADCRLTAAPLVKS